MDEFVIEWLRGQTVAAITAPAGSALKTRLKKLAAEHPDECDFIENNDGSVFGHVPLKCVKVSWPRQYSEETKQKMAEQIARVREKKESKTVLND